ncbi:MAG: ABC transporter ATP-binding protein [Actinomycetota bacterium]
MTAPGPSATVVEMRGITKRFGDTVANEGVDFDLRAGEIHVLLGENGAGKTTLMSVLFGHIAPDAGEIWVRGKQAEIKSPADAIDLGIGMVHQHFSLVPTFTVAQNVVLGLERATNLRLRISDIEERVRKRAEELAMAIDPGAVVGDLPVDLQQRVEIIKALYRGGTTLILDEPTALLGPAQIANLLEILDGLRRQGHSIVLVTHKLAEVMEVADRVTVLRRGRWVHQAVRGEFDERSLAMAMTGQEFEAVSAVAHEESGVEPVLEARHLLMRRIDESHGGVLDDLSFVLRPGEILGIAGVEGNGQRELFEALTGLRKVQSGQILLGGVEVTHAEPAERRGRGLGVIPEDRHGLGLVLDMTLAENLMVTEIPQGTHSRWGLLRWKDIRSRARQILEEYDVRPPDPQLKAASLSGGNQQKVVLAREMSRRPAVLIADNPTWGLDVGAIDYVHRQLLEMRDRGGAVLLLTLDLDELLLLADRIVVLHRGRGALERNRRDIAQDELALAMTGRSDA